MAHPARCRARAARAASHAPFIGWPSPGSAILLGSVVALITGINAREWCVYTCTYHEHRNPHDPSHRLEELAILDASVYSSSYMLVRCAAALASFVTAPAPRRPTWPRLCSSLLAGSSSSNISSGARAGRSDHRSAPHAFGSREHTHTVVVTSAGDLDPSD